MRYFTCFAFALRCSQVHDKHFPHKTVEFIDPTQAQYSISGGDVTTSAMVHIVGVLDAASEVLQARNGNPSAVRRELYLTSPRSVEALRIVLFGPSVEDFGSQSKLGKVISVTNLKVSNHPSFGLQVVGTASSVVAHGVDVPEEAAYGLHKWALDTFEEYHSALVGPDAVTEDFDLEA